MKKLLSGVFIGLSVLVLGTNLVNAMPVYNNQTAPAYFDAIYKDAKKNGYQDLQDHGENLRIQNLHVGKINRDIVDGEYNHPYQFYINYVGKELAGTSEARPGQGWDRETYSIQQKLDFVALANRGQSQFMFPMIMARLEESNYDEFWEADFNVAPFENENFDKNNAFAQPQGYMYAETDAAGKTVVKQFDYEKDTEFIKVMWNAKTESMIIIALEKGEAPDKIMYIRTDVDEVYRLIRVTGELIYTGNQPKNITLLNQMVYDTKEHLNRDLVMHAYETYGKKKGFMMPMPDRNASIVIRTDLEHGPANWAIKQYPYAVPETGGDWQNARGVEASDPKKFLSAFTPPTIDGLGAESNSQNDVNGQKLTEQRIQKYRWSDPYNFYSGTWSINSVNLKSPTRELSKGESLKLVYGYEPTTRYKVPSLVPISNTFKNEQDNYSTLIKWMDAVSGSQGGEIGFFVNGQPVDVTVDGTLYNKYTYQKAGDVAGEFKVSIDKKHFKPGIDNKIKVEIKDEILIKDPNGVSSEEHSSSREFKVSNRRLIPIKYKTSGGKELTVTENEKTSVNLMDGTETATVVVPETMTEKGYPLVGVEPKNANVSIKKNTITIKGHTSLKDGISVIYKVLQVDGTVKFLNAKGEPILKDIKGNKELESYPLTGMDIGSSIQAAIDNAKKDLKEPLNLIYDGYSLVPGYKVMVNGKEVADQTVIPDSDFEVHFFYNGAASLVTIPDIVFNPDNKAGSITNDSEKKQNLTSDKTTLEIYDTSNEGNTKVTLSLASAIQNENNKPYHGDIKYKTGVAGEDDQVLAMDSQILVMKTEKDKFYNSVSLNNSVETKPNLYLVQYPGNYGGNYTANLIWKIEPDTAKDMAK